jgi:Domain of unknown function (DUF6321)
VKTPAWQRAEGKNKKGGLNAKGRASYKAETGGTLKAPVKSAPDSPQEMRRKGSFLTRMGSMPGLLFDEQGDKTRLKLSLEAWGHQGDKKSAVAKGRRLLDQYKRVSKSAK